MKTLISLFIATFMCVASTFADDAAIVANWKFPIAYWFPNGSIPTVGIANYPRAQVVADSIADFDAAGAVFDEVWTSLTRQGNGYSIANTTGNPASHTGAADFTGAFKVVYDQTNIYILLKYTDEDIKGTESVELMWAPDLSIPAIAALPVAQLPTGNAQQAPYARYGQFGGYKASFSKTGYGNSMIVDFNATTGVGNINWGGTNAILTQALSFDDKTDLGSHDVKAIYTIGFQALTGNAYPTAQNGRPNFTNAIWRALNGGKGFSFDIHIIDFDTNDALNTATPAVVKPQEYWWNSTNNDGYAQTYYSGFIGLPVKTAVKSVYSNKPAIFGEVASTQVKLTQNAKVEVFNSIGKRVLTLKETNKVDFTNMKKGVYIIKANNETLKFVR